MDSLSKHLLIQMMSIISISVRPPVLFGSVVRSYVQLHNSPNPPTTLCAIELTCCAPAWLGNFTTTQQVISQSRRNGWNWNSTSSYHWKRRNSPTSWYFFQCFFFFPWSIHFDLQKERQPPPHLQKNALEKGEKEGGEQEGRGVYLPSRTSRRRGGPWRISEGVDLDFLYVYLRVSVLCRLSSSTLTSAHYLSHHFGFFIHIFLSHIFPKRKTKKKLTRLNSCFVNLSQVERDTPVVQKKKKWLAIPCLSAAHPLTATGSQRPSCVVATLSSDFLQILPFFGHRACQPADGLI